MVSRDTSVGLVIWQNMQVGGGWNQLDLPDPANIALSKPVFVTWWSPGQYVPTGLLLQLGLPLGSAVLAVSLLSALSLAAGMHKLSRALGATPDVAAWTALVTVASWHTLYSFGMYVGGEAVLLAVWPWIVLATWHLRARPWLQLTVLPPLFLLGSFAKLAFGIYAVGLLGFLWLEESRANKFDLNSLLKTSVRLAGIFSVYVGLLYWLYLGRGPSPVSGQAGSNNEILTVVGFALNAPWLAATGGGSFLGRIFMLVGLTPEAGIHKLSPVLFVTGFTALFIYWRALCSSQSLFRLAGTISLVAVLLLAGLWLRGANISLEDRHLRPAGVLLLAAGAQLAGGVQPRWIMFSARVVLVLAVGFGLGAFAQRVDNIRQQALRLPNGISLTGLDSAMLARMEQLDSPDAGRLVYLPQPEMALLMSRARLLPTDAVIHDRAWLAIDTRHGRVAELILVLPAGFAHDGRADTIRGSFVDYTDDEWQRTRVGAWDFWRAASPARPTS